MFCLALHSYVSTALRLKLTLACVIVARFSGTMGDFICRPLMKQIEHVGGVMLLSTAPVIGEEGQPPAEVGLVVVEIAG